MVDLRLMKFSKFEIFDEGDGGFGVVVAIDQGDFEDVLGGIGLEVAPDV